MEEWRDVPGFSNYQVSNNGNLRKKMVPIVKGKYFKKCHSKYSEISEHEWMPFKKMYSPDGFLYLKSRLIAGYPSFNITLGNGNKKTIKAHRLVATAFIDNPENKPFVNHKNGIKTDNRVENIEWCTPQENVNHAKKNGLIPLGQKCGKAKLFPIDVLIIREAFSIGRSIKSISKYYKVARPTIRSIINGKSWSHV